MNKLDVKKSNKFLRILKHCWPFYLLIAPAVILMFVFHYVPIYGLVIAFKEWRPRLGITGSPWIGFDHFQTAFASDVFWSSFKNTFVINILKLLIGFPAPILLAVMLNAVRNKYAKSFVQTVLYLPHFLSWVIIANLLFSLLESGGPVQILLKYIGIKDFDILSNGNASVALLVFSDLWKETGWGAIIYLAALTGINAELYEAADIDGARTVQKFWKITLPSILPTVSIMLTLRVGGLAGGGFEQIYALFSGNEAVYDSVYTLDVFLYERYMTKGAYDIGTAIGLFTNVINVILLVSANLIVKGLGGEGVY